MIREDECFECGADMFRMKVCVNETCRRQEEFSPSVELALAEAVCEAHAEWIEAKTFDDYNAAVVKRHEALVAWLASKGRIPK